MFKLIVLCDAAIFAGSNRPVQLLHDAGLVGDTELLVGAVALAAEGVLYFCLGVGSLALDLCLCRGLTVHLEYKEDGGQVRKHDEPNHTKL